jgi:hypothetical protein
MSRRWTVGLPAWMCILDFVCNGTLHESAGPFREVDLRSALQYVKCVVMPVEVSRSHVQIAGTLGAARASRSMIEPMLLVS